MISNKVKMICYGLAVIAGFANAYFAWSGGNIDAALAWFCASGMAGGASAAYGDLHNKE